MLIRRTRTRLKDDEKSFYLLAAYMGVYVFDVATWREIQIIYAALTLVHVYE
jgi:hypothetical protein